MMGENVAITDFMIFGDDCNGFTTSEIAQMVYFLRDGDKRSVACYVHNGVPEFLMTTTVLSRLRLHLRLLSLRSGISVAQPAMSELGVPAQPGIGAVSYTHLTLPTTPYV